MRWLVPVLFLTAVTGCRERADPIVIGAKSFTEQAILAEIVAERLRGADFRVQVRTCGDTWTCQRALRSGDLDLSVDYTGTGLQFVGAPPAGATVEAVRTLYEPLGVVWAEALGFDNGYRVLVPASRAARDGLRTVSDLGKLGAVRIAVPDEYRRRPGDGLGALVDRYGLSLAGSALVIDDPTERYEALLQGRADIAIGYATDGALVGLSVVTLDDDERFFPPYEAVILKTKALAGDAGVTAALAPLEGLLSEKVMRSLNHEVDVLGHAPRATARRYLGALHLADPGEQTPANALHVTGFADDTMQPFVARALRAVRRVFPERAVVFRPHDDPISSVAAGESRLAVVGAERFFAGADREERIEAVAVLGVRHVHVLRAAGDGLAGRVGIQPAETSGGRFGAAVTGAAGVNVALQATSEELVAALNRGRLDAALIVTHVGDPVIVAATRAGLKLTPIARLPPDQADALPWLRPARIPASSYAAQPTAIETVGSQVLLAGPSAVESTLSGAGPAAAVAASASPLSRADVRALADATGVPEAPSPALPSAWSVTGDRGAGAGSDGWTSTALNLLVLLFLGWWLRLVVLTPSAAVSASRSAPPDASEAGPP